MAASRLAMRNKIVDMPGDEMAAILWKSIKEKIIQPHVELNTEEYDLSLTNRDQTDDTVTAQAAHAIAKHQVGAKCATITPDEARMREFGLKKMWRSPNATIRSFLEGTVFRHDEEPIVISGLPRLVPGWKKPIIIGRHAFGDQYAATDFKTEGPGKLEVNFSPANGGASESRIVHNFQGQNGGIAMCMFNTEESIKGFAKSCFEHALQKGMPLLFGTKNTILKSYDGFFRDVFTDIYAREYKDAFERAGIYFEHRLIDDLLAQALKSEGGFVWACKNYEGDLFADLVGQAYGSLALMKSQLVAPDGKTIETEAAHGTITRHWRYYQQGKETSTNPIASIFAWTGALRQRGILDDSPDLVQLASDVEASVRETVESGLMTKDLASFAKGDALSRNDYLETFAFLDAIADTLKSKRR